MFIHCEATPNPRTIKFLPGVSVSSQPLDFVTAPSDDILLQELFDVYGVCGVHFGTEAVSVTVEDPSMWAEARPLAIKALSEHFGSFDPTRFYKLACSNGDDSDDSEAVARIKEVLEKYVRPSVAADGGDIVFGSFDPASGILKVSMRGACSGCPSSTATLKMGIQNLMNHFAPEVKDIQSL